MRWAAILAMLVLAQCATPGEDDRFQVGASENALVIIGVAKAPTDLSPRYSLLWRQLDAAGGFRPLSGRASFEAKTNEGDTVRVRGIPGEFAVLEVEPGTYALDGAFAVIHDRRVDYVAQGVIAGPDRPAFDVRAGEAVYLGIWQVDIEETVAVTRLWRLDAADMRAVLRQADVVNGQVDARQTYTRAVPCAPHQVSNVSTRRVC